MRTVDLRADARTLVQQVARLLVEALREHDPEARVRDFERQVVRRGAPTVCRGTGDVDGTSVAGIELRPDGLAHARRMPDRRGHPYEFCRTLGHVVIGALPDANTLARPDIMAKRVGC